LGYPFPIREFGHGEGDRLASCKKILLLAVALILFIFSSGCEKDSPLPQNKADDWQAEQAAGSGKAGDAGDKAETAATGRKTGGDIKEKAPAADSAASGDQTGTGASGNPAEKAGETAASDHPEKNPDNPEKNGEKEKKTGQEAGRSGQTASGTSPGKKSGTGAASPASRPEPAVTVSVIGLDDHGKTKVFLPPSKIGIGSKDTVFTATIRIPKENNIPYEASGSGASAYVIEINDLEEFDYGPLSGWLYKKNGVIVNRGAGSEPVKNGDEIVWFYTKDFTKTKN